MQGGALSAAIGTYISQLYINGELRDIIEDDVEEKTDHAVGVTIAVAIAWLTVEGFVTAVRIFKIGMRLEKINLLLTVFLIVVSRGRLHGIGFHDLTWKFKACQVYYIMLSLIHAGYCVGGFVYSGYSC